MISSSEPAMSHAFRFRTHLDSEGAPLPLRIQTLVSKAEQDLEARRRPPMEPVALNLCVAREEASRRQEISSTLLVGFKWTRSNFTQKVRRPLGWFNAESPAYDNYANRSQPSVRPLAQLELLRQVGERSHVTSQSRQTIFDLLPCWRSPSSLP